MSTRDAYAGSERHTNSSNDDNSLTYKWLVGILMGLMTAIALLYISANISWNNKLLEAQQQHDQRLTTIETKMDYISASMETLLKRVDN